MVRDEEEAGGEKERTTAHLAGPLHEVEKMETTWGAQGPGQLGQRSTGCLPAPVVLVPRAVFREQPAQL